MSNDYPISGLINPQDKKDLEKLIADLNEASKVAKTVVLGGGDAKNLKQVADAQEKINKAQREAETHAKKIEALNQKMAVTAQKEADRIEATRKKNADAELKRLEKEAQAQRKVTEQAEKGAQARQKLIETAGRGDGSVEALTAQYKLNTEAINKMTRAERENSSEALELIANTRAIKEELNKAGGSVGNFTGQVGGYQQAIEGAVMNLGEMKKELAVLKNMSFIGKSEEEIKAVKLRIGELMDATGDLKAEMQVLGTEKSAVFVSGLKFISAGVEGVVGSLSLMGVESNVVKNLEQKMTSLIAVTQALAEIEDVVSSGKLKAIGLRLKDMAMNVVEAVQKKALAISTNAITVAEEARTVATAQGSIATKTAAAVQWLWNKAILANPIVATVVAVGALAFAIYKLVGAQEKETDEQRIANEIKEKSIKINEEWSDKIKQGVEAGAKNVTSLLSLKKGTNEYKKELTSLILEYDGYLSKTDKSKLANADLAATFDILAQAILNKAVTEAFAAKIEEQAVLATQATMQKIQLQREEQIAYEKMLKTQAGTQERADADDKLRDIRLKILANQSLITFQMQELQRIMDERDNFMRQAGISGAKAMGTAYKATGDVLKDALNIFLETNAQEQKIIQQTIDNESELLEVRLKAIDDLKLKKKEAINAQLKYEEDHAQKVIQQAIADGKTTAEINDIKKQLDADYLLKKLQFDNELYNMEIEFGKKGVELINSDEKNKAEYRKYWQDVQFTEMDNLLKERLLRTDIAKNKELEMLAIGYSNGAISYDEYQKEKQKIEEDYAEQSIDLQLETLQKELNILKLRTDLTDEEKDKIIDIEKQISDLKIKNAEEVARTQNQLDDERQKRLEEYADAVKSVMGGIGDIYDAISARQLQNIEEGLKADTEAKDAQIEALDAQREKGTITEANYIKKKKKIEDDYDKKVKKAQQEKDEIAYKQAVWKKAQAIAEIAINIALNLAKGDYVTASIGGLALIAAAAQPLPPKPKYRTGTNFHPGGVATVGDGGRELLEMPDGSKYLASKEITAIFPRGMKVLKNSDTENVLKSGVTIEPNAIDISSLDAKIDKSNKFLKQIAEKQQINRIFVGDNSLRNHYKYN